jgi:hypothetical protein
LLSRNPEGEGQTQRLQLQKYAACVANLLCRLHKHENTHSKVEHLYILASYDIHTQSVKLIIELMPSEIGSSK